MKIIVNSVQGLQTLLKGIVCITEGVRIIVKKSGCFIASGNKSQTIRAYFESNTMYLAPEEGEENIQLDFKDTLKFIQVLGLIQETPNFKLTDRIILEYKLINTGAFLVFNGTSKCKSKWKLKLDNAISTEDFVTPPLKNESVLIPTFSWEMTDDQIKKLTKYSSLNSGIEIKTYFSLEENVLKAELDDKTAALLSTVSFPIYEFKEGELNEKNNLTKTIAADLKIVQLWTILSKKVKIDFAVDSVFIVNSVYLDETSKTTMKLICPRLRA
jgi:hypothetical protein